MEQKPSAKLHRGIKLKDLVLMNISCVVGLTTLPLVAQFGFGSIFLFVLAIITFLIPSGIIVTELNNRIPGQGGFYLWTRKAFGDRHGYIAAWSYWLANVTWFPSTLLIISSVFLYALGDSYQYLEDSLSYNILICLVVVWLLTLLNIVGIEKAKWVQNISGISNWISIILLIGFGIFYVAEYGSAHEITMENFLPDLSNHEILPYFAIAAFCFGGLELAPVMADEIQNPRINIPKALLISSVAIGIIYIAGTLILVITIPEGEIDVRDGIAQAFNEFGSAIGPPWIANLGGILLTISTLGLFGAWLTGNSRIPFVIGIDHYLPEAFGRVHPRFGTPVVSLVMQAIVITVLLLSSLAGSNVEEAYLLLLDMSVVLYYIPFLYMFSAFLYHMRKGDEKSGLIPFIQKT